MKTNYYSTALSRTFRGLTIITFSLLVFYSCVESDKKPNDNIQVEMISLMNTLRDAAMEIDAEKIINLCLDTPEFLFASDGSVMTYDQFVEAEIEGFKEFESHEVTWDTMYVKTLSPDVVSALAPFHQKITLKDGTIFQQKGEVTCIATRTDEGLKLIYGHAGHRPDIDSH